MVIGYKCIYTCGIAAKQRKASTASKQPQQASKQARKQASKHSKLAQRTSKQARKQASNQATKQPEHDIAQLLATGYRIQAIGNMVISLELHRNRGAAPGLLIIAN